ncbi:hypothetical protein AC579_3588 [Pseudocercospora musae]|uniref:Uncharacterized protein n=1 Tax=Pseudocercospora musae TaxID=113226 RepID=A0A139IVZ9_9PEZI|nr:hypothetical protein AC579_3588 [Pseudocercospora musae]
MTHPVLDVPLFGLELPHPNVHAVPGTSGGKMGTMHPEVDLKGCSEAAAHLLATDVLYLAKHAHVKKAEGLACSRADQAIVTSATVLTLLRRRSCLRVTTDRAAVTTMCVPIMGKNFLLYML